MGKILIENTAKNILILILLYAFYQPIVELYSKIDATHYDSLLTTVTLLIMAALFADYAFTYGHSKMESTINRWLSHIITFLIMLCTGVMLESVVILLRLKTGMDIWVMTFVSIAFYISLVLYDYWDIWTTKKDKA